MKTIILILSFLMSFSVFASDPNRADTLREKLLSGDINEVFVVAHRGDWRYAPENSIAAIEHSIEIGVDVVELDLQLSKDSVLFVIHDSKLERTTTGKGRIYDWTADSLRTLKLKNGAGIRTMHSLPTLEDAMLAAKGRVLVNLDKADRYFDLLMPILEKTGTASQVIIKGTKSAALVDSLYGAYLDQCGGHDDDCALKNPDNAYGYLINTLGANIIQTDRAEYLLDYLRARSLHE